jgi:hypothetical protein
MSSSSFLDVMRPGGRFVVARAGLQAAVEDAGCREFWTGTRRQRLFLLVKGSLANFKHDERLDCVPT